MPPYISRDKAVALLAKIPAIPARQAELTTELFGRLRTLLDRSPRAKLLSILKYAAYIVLLLNFGSWPFVWHIRVFWPLFAPRLEYLSLCFKLVLASKKARADELTAWAENLSPVGANPFEVTHLGSRWASIDDIDMFGMHLSNSSYAKALDSLRARALVRWFPAWGRSGGRMALGATHYHFIREIAALARYEVRLTIGSWDHKWIYLVARFVTRPRRRDSDQRSPQSSTPSTPNDGPVQNGTADIERAVAAITPGNNGPGRTRRAPIVEPDGAILHCVAVSQICFRLHRVTLPPAVVLASEGFTKPFGEGDGVVDAGKDAGVRTYSHANPPPNWIKSQSLRVPPHGSVANFGAFLKSGWRDVPEGERWWEDALGGSIERKRQANLEIIESLKLGLERTRTLR